MSPNEVRSLNNRQILEMLVSMRPGADEAVSWLAAVIADPVMVEGVRELSRRYVADTDGRSRLPRARSAGTVLIDGAKFKHVMWLNRIPMNQVGPSAGRTSGRTTAYLSRELLRTASPVCVKTVDAHSSPAGCHGQSKSHNGNCESRIVRKALPAVAVKACT